MNCLEEYRSHLVGEINREFRSILQSPEEDPVHDFRVGVKRITAFYLFLQSVDPNIRAKKILKPYRGLFKAIGGVRDLHIAENLCLELGAERRDIRKLKNAEKKHYQAFLQRVENHSIKGIRVPTVRSLGLSNNLILKNQKPYLYDLLSQICVLDGRLTSRSWHRKRILIKRYHHTLDAFQYCPGHAWDEEELKQIKILEQLLGDWHDRVISNSLIKNNTLANSDKLLPVLKRQGSLLVGSARIYLQKYISQKRETGVIK